mgnify:CR=1 FL=1
MAAFDLKTATPAMLQIPDSVNQGSRNMMQFMRQQQDSRNQKDRLALEGKKADAAAEFRAGQLDLDQQRTDNALQDTLTDNNLAQQRQNFVEGADQRAIDVTKTRNKSINDAITTGKTSLASDFSIGEENLSLLMNDPRVQAMSPEKQTEFLKTQQLGMQARQAQDIGPGYLFQSLVNNLTNSNTSFEESQEIAKGIVAQEFPDADLTQFNMAREMAKNFGGGNQGGSSKSLAYDDTGKLQSQQKAYNERLGSLNIPKTKSWMDWAGGENLDENKVKGFTDDLLKKFNLPPLIGLTAVESLFEDDELIDNGSTLEGMARADFNVTIGGKKQNLTAQEFMSADFDAEGSNASPDQRMLQQVLSTGTALQAQQQSGNRGNGESRQQQTAGVLVDQIAKYQSPQQKANGRRLKIYLSGLNTETQETLNTVIAEEGEKAKQPGVSGESKKGDSIVDIISKESSEVKGPTSEADLITSLQERLSVMNNKKLNPTVNRRELRDRVTLQKTISRLTEAMQGPQDIAFRPEDMAQLESLLGGNQQGSPQEMMAAQGTNLADFLAQAQSKR